MPLRPEPRPPPHLFGRQPDAVAGGEFLGDIEIPVLIGEQERDVEPEPVGQRQLLLHGLIDMHIVIAVRRRAAPVAEALAHEMPAVAGRVENHVVRTGFQAPLQRRLQRLVLCFVLLERQVVDEENEPLAPTGERGDDLGVRAQVLLGDLDQAEPLGVKLGEQGLHRRGLPRPPVPVQQHVVGGHSRDELTGVVQHRPALQVVAHEIAQPDGIRVRHALQVAFAVPPVDPPERVVAAEDPDPIGGKVSGEVPHERAPVAGSGKTLHHQALRRPLAGCLHGPEPLPGDRVRSGDAAHVASERGATDAGASLERREVRPGLRQERRADRGHRDALRLAAEGVLVVEQAPQQVVLPGIAGGRLAGEFDL